jgi:hypothetical protein
MIDFDAARKTLDDYTELLLLPGQDGHGLRTLDKVQELYSQIQHVITVGELAHRTLDCMIANIFDPVVMELTEAVVKHDKK